MPIPQLKSTFHKRKISDRPASFSSRPILSDVRKRKPLKKRTSHRKRPRKKVSGNWLQRFWKRYWKQVTGLVLLGGIFIIIMFAWYSKDLPEPGKIMDRSVALSAKIYDRDEEVMLYEVHGAENRTLISIDDIPQHVIDATIAIEDKNFYNHQGISLWGIIRGQIMPRLQGKRSQGGSTLTQQFVKNAILTDERKVSRKIKEWILSYQIEKKYDKRQILEFYFNEIPYGGSVYGVEAASHYYFGKPVAEITIAEAAILAALPQAPTKYSPYGSHKDVLIGRQHTIINLMEEQGYITEEQVEEAKEQELVFKKRAENIKAPHFVMYVRELLEQEYGTSVVEQSGWTVVTSLDWEAQEKAEAAIEEIAESNEENFAANNAALVSLDADTSQIIAMVGSKDYFNDEIDGQVNVAISERQPGSSMKPLAYLAAFAKGFRPETIIFDVVTNFSSAGKDYIPQNYDGETRGPVSLRQALAGSLNIPAVKTLYLAGVYNTLDLAADFGYTTLDERDRYGLSLVLGGGEVKLLEHVNAYATMAREGIYKDTVAILEIKDAKGNTIEDNRDNKGRRVIDKEPVRVLNDVLSDNGARAYMFGENNYLTLGERPVAAKTGTTNDYRDAWTIGFTPNIATGVWVGNNDNTAMGEGASGSSVAAPIWNKYMRTVTEGTSIESFKKHDQGECTKPMVCGELGGKTEVEIDKRSGKLATEYTPYTDRETKKYFEVHNILYYVNTNDPLGEPLSDPSADPQYILWEEPVIDWASEEGYLNDDIPTEYDDIHTSDLQPDISWLEPRNNDSIRQSNFSMRTLASAPRGISRVEYFLDDEKIGQAYSSPFNFTYHINPFVSNGDHRLKAIAFDDLDNFKETTITINIQVDKDARNYNIVWLNPSSGDTISKNGLPMNLELNIDNPQNVDKVDFYYLSPDDNSHWFTYVQPSQENISVSWGEGLEPGVYKLYMVVKDVVGSVITTPSIILNVE